MAAKTKQRRKGKTKTAAQGNTRSPQATVTPDPRAAEAARLQGGGEHDRASELWHAILQDRPDDLAALQHLGVLQLQQPDGDTDLADRLLGRAAELLPQSAPAAMHHGLALQRAGRHADAETALRRALALKPDYAEAHNNLGVTLAALGRDSEASKSFKEALRLKPDHGAAQRNLQGLPHRTTGADELHRLAEAAVGRGAHAEAAELYRQIKAMEPENAEVRVALANALQHARDYDAATAELHALLHDHPFQTYAYVALAKVAFERGAYEDSLSYLDRVPAEDPNFPKTHYVRANVLSQTGRTALAIECYKRALETAPNDASLLNDYALSLSANNESTEASMALLRAITLDPTSWQPYANLSSVLKDQGRVLDSLEVCEQALAKTPNNAVVASNWVLNLNYISGLSNAAVFDGHLTFQQVLGHIEPWRSHANDRSPERRLRIGYVSPDFRRHSVARFFEPLLRNHDRDNFEIYLYSNTGKEDQVTERLRAMADGWRSIFKRSSAEAADTIGRDGIDILVDLAGHTGGNSLEVFQRKPAPVQTSWLGYPNTTGLGTIDYRIVDEVVEPSGEADAFSTESIVRLPNGFHCLEPLSKMPDIGPLPSVEAGFVRFGSFNYLAKVNEEVVRTWARILKAVPDSRLLMKARGLGDTLSNDSYLSLFEAQGVSRERIEIARYQPTPEDHLALYNQVDIALDTFPYNGTTTTCEALSMGVPVIALRGFNHASRISASLLQQVGLSDLIGADLDDYVERAVALANNPEKMTRLRSDLRAMLEASSLRDELGFARKFECALREMWRHWCAEGTKGDPAPVAVDRTAQNYEDFNHDCRKLVNNVNTNPSGIVWVSSYPKSGNTWVRFIICALLGQDTTDSVVIEENVPDIHKQSRLVVPPGERKFVKTHFAYDASPQIAQATQGIIYVVRNPLDVLTSNLSYLGIDTTSETAKQAFVDEFIASGGVERWRQAGMGSWEHNLQSWAHASTCVPYLFLRYEDMLADPASAVSQIAEFIGLTPNPEEIERVINETSFDTLRALEAREKNGGASGFFTSESRSKSSTHFRFMNKGRVGTYADVLSERQIARVLERFKAAMQAAGYQVDRFWPNGYVE